MARTLAFKRLKFKNPYPQLLRAYQRDAKNLPKKEAAFTYRRARSIMKKAPKKPKSRYGNYRMYNANTYDRRKKRLAASGQLTAPGFWRKGLYSRPGHPPYYHGESGDFNLRRIEFHPTRPHVPHAQSRGKAYAWVVGPLHDSSKAGTSVPQLHEYGGTIRLKYDRGKRTYQAKGLKQSFIKTKKGQTVKYPPRPYMRPAAKEARESAARKSPYTLRAITKLGNMKGKRIY